MHNKFLDCGKATWQGAGNDNCKHNACDSGNGDCESRAIAKETNDAVGLSSTADSACSGDVESSAAAGCAAGVGVKTLEAAGRGASKKVEVFACSRAAVVDSEAYAKKIGDLAVKALLYELNTTPKPGLVDKENNGAHTDMDYEMFRASAYSLRECFEDCARAGLENGLDRRGSAECGSAECGSAECGVESSGYGVVPDCVESESQIGDVRNRGLRFEPSKELLEFRLRKIGLAGERKMFRTTGGVNTHKGLIFSLGIICAALGLLAGEELETANGTTDSAETDSRRGFNDFHCGELRIFDAAVLQHKCAEIARKILEVGRTTENTHGNIVYAKTGIYGAKGEALSGFATSFEVGLPVLRNVLEAGLSGNDAMVVTLLYLMAVTDDSNLVYRGGLEGLKFVKEKSHLLIDCDFDIESVRAFDRECIERNLSPGGSADLLAITAMLHMIIKGDGQRTK